MDRKNYRDFFSDPELVAELSAQDKYPSKLVSMSPETESLPSPSMPPEDLALPPPLPKKTRTTAGQSPIKQLPTVQTEEDISDRDFLRNYIARQKENQAQLDTAEDRALNNRLYAHLGGAVNTISQGLAGQKPDNAPFELMAKAADGPIDRLQRRQKSDSESDKVVFNYLANKAEKKSRDEHRQAMLDMYGKSLGLREKGLSLREGTQAGQVADKFNKDKVILTANTQLSQIDKALGRLADVDAGKVPFSTTIKADIEKDIANVISGGTSSSLGQLHRIEFEPYVAKWQAAIDKLTGYQGDIQAPEFKRQLRETLSGLRADIGKIQAKRARDLERSLGTAYSGNETAKKTIQDNVGLYGDAGLSERDKEAIAWAKSNAQNPDQATASKAQKILQLHGVR